MRPSYAFPSLLAQLNDDAEPLHEVTQNQELILKGNFLHVVRDTVLQPNGKLASREYVKHPGAVVIIPILDDGRLLVERQYRHAMGRMMIEFPAGKLDPDEPQWKCALRELREETGLHARQLAYAGEMHNCIGYSDEFIAIWLARHMVQGEQALEEGELLRLSAATLDELLACMHNGQLTDAKTLTCMLWLQQMQAGTWQPEWQEWGG